MVAARRAFLQAGYYDPSAARWPNSAWTLRPKTPRIVDAGCGEGSYDETVLAAFAGAGRAVQLIGFDLAKPAVRLAAKLVPQALFAVGGSFCAPVADGWADVLLNVFSPFAAAEFARMLRPGGVLIYAVPTPRHLYGLKEILYDRPYENPDQNTDYPGFVRLPDRERTVTAALTAGRRRGAAAVHDDAVLLQHTGGRGRAPCRAADPWDRDRLPLPCLHRREPGAITTKKDRFPAGRKAVLSDCQKS